jgi:hypothetical protein
VGDFDEKQAWKTGQAQLFTAEDAESAEEVLVSCTKSFLGTAVHQRSSAAGLRGILWVGCGTAFIAEATRTKGESFSLPAREAVPQKRLRAVRQEFPLRFSAPSPVKQQCLSSFSKPVPGVFSGLLGEGPWLSRLRNALIRHAIIR